ncbi:uncharacterized protein [Sinocyclocheilus grahami]|uniref:uncharacterized protein n=1 Tax=Sinocyclocheilus grahami TaxID=75366 RepID=UPI0007ACDC9D|nr:PREDICTED: uncharacterized protein LOC107573881 [Sinocyclocheilus grahami]
MIFFFLLIKVLKMKFPFILLSVCLFFPEHGVSGVETNGVLVSVMEGDSITLHTGIKKAQEDRIRWYFNETRIAQINGDPSKTCTDVQCNVGTERFRDRLKLDHQTGSLTIMNTRTTDAGVYQLKIFSSSSISEKTFSVSVRGVSAAERDKTKRKSVKEGESVTLDPAVMKNPNHVMTWYFSDSGPSPAAVAGICVGLLLASAAVGVICYHRRRTRLLAPQEDSHDTA